MTVFYKPKLANSVFHLFCCEDEKPAGAAHQNTGAVINPVGPSSSTVRTDVHMLHNYIHTSFMIFRQSQEIEILASS